MKKLLLLFTVHCLLSTVLAGCAGVTTVIPPKPKDTPGIYHQVKKGQTLWRISKIYNLEIERIAEINHLPDTSRIYEGQLIFIPEATRQISAPAPQVGPANKGEEFIWPTKGRVSAHYGMKTDRVKNEGIYVQTSRNADVFAARSGRVNFCSENMRGYGKIIIIDHLDGYSTVYAQNAINIVKLNTLVKQGQVIARTGTSARRGVPELYFEIRNGQKAQNPFFYLP